MTKSGRVERGNPCFFVFSIPVDFFIEFWNSTFSRVFENTEEIFLTALAELSNGANQGSVAASVQKLFKFFSGLLNLNRL